MKTICSPKSRLPDVGTTIFALIGDLAARYDALNLSQGAPNFPCDPALIQAAARAMRAGHNQYSPMAGLAPLREALSVKIERLYGARYGAEDEITIVASASEGLYASISALVHPGDEVIYFEPAFDSYAPIVRLQGATPVPIELSPHGFRIDWDEVAAVLSPRTRMIIVNTPHNPTATVFDGALHHGMARHPELAGRSVIVHSFGKSYHVTGWRLGCCPAPADLMNEIRKVHQFMAFAADTPMQYAFLEALGDESGYLARFRGFSDESDSDFALRHNWETRI